MRNAVAARIPVRIQGNHPLKDFLGSLGMVLVFASGPRQVSILFVSDRAMMMRRPPICNRIAMDQSRSVRAHHHPMPDGSLNLRNMLLCFAMAVWFPRRAKIPI